MHLRPPAQGRLSLPLLLNPTLDLLLLRPRLLLPHSLLPHQLPPNQLLPQ